MAIKDTVTDRLLGSERGDRREYRYDTCHSSFSSRESPEVAACPGGGAHRVLEQ